MLVDESASTALSSTAEPPQIGAIKIQSSNTTRNFEEIALNTLDHPQIQSTFAHHPYGHNGDE